MRNVCIAVAVFAALAVTVTPARAEGGHGTFTVGYFQVKPGTLPSLSGGDTGVSHLKGINVKYRYELTDSVGVMASLGFAASKKSSTVMTGEDTFHYESLRGRYVSVMAGPVLQISKQVSEYAMAGVAHSRWSGSTMDYRKTEITPGYMKETTTARDESAMRHTSVAWSAGIQINPAASVVVDIAYEGSGSGDWRTDGFIVGVGYKF